MPLAALCRQCYPQCRSRCQFVFGVPTPSSPIAVAVAAPALTTGRAVAVWDRGEGGYVGNDVPLLKTPSAARKPRGVIVRPPKITCLLAATIAGLAGMALGTRPSRVAGSGCNIAFAFRVFMSRCLASRNVWSTQRLAMPQQAEKQDFALRRGLSDACACSRRSHPSVGATARRRERGRVR
jgi:hypothetical protein